MPRNRQLTDEQRRANGLAATKRWRAEHPEAARAISLRYYRKQLEAAGYSVVEPVQ